jgi:hypothetical protein
MYKNLVARALTACQATCLSLTESVPCTRVSS